jgi:hypothetical protein
VETSCSEVDKWLEVEAQAFGWVPQLHMHEAEIRKLLEQATGGESCRGELSLAEGGQRRQDLLHG